MGTSAPSVGELTKPTQPPLLFVLSIDTEEEWDWEQGFPESDFALDNIKQLPGLQALFAELGVRPTYFVDYAVADDSQAVHTLRPYVEEKLCEIGAHLHPWANPPFYGATGEKESHVVNLPSSQVEAKLKALIDKLREQFGTTPRSFRTGRWGINGEVLQLLTQYGIDVDSSVYPFYRTDYFDCSDAPLLPYWPDSQTPTVAGAQRAIYEIPVTVGFNRADFSKSNAIYKQLSHPAAKLLRPVGVAWHTRLLRQLYLCPELTTSDDMIALCQRALENDYPVLHMFMHSSSLVDNGNSLVAQKNAFETITTAIRRVVDFVSEQRAVRFCTISEAGHLLKQRC
ncbi:polysaccharide deacetylase family protein [Alteromonas sp. ASW11-19]|uniref:Polysaccharide deacetylase family protein n=1 Tax=Alteromonas salexigens TaxID=2982530 RepID=A0ABT2VPY3_9ALTE|nr:polysaccharide deacetylase family protein [Alteromonas salexigens]